MHVSVCVCVSDFVRLSLRLIWAVHLRAHTLRHTTTDTTTATSPTYGAAVANMCANDTRARAMIARAMDMYMKT